MRLQVHGKQIDVGAALRTHAQDRLSALLAKYFGGEADGTVTFSREAHWFRCDCHVHLSSGMALQASANAGDAYAAFDEVAERLEKRLRRYNRRLKDHHAARQPVETFVAPAYVLEDTGEEAEEPAGPAEPVVIAEMTTDVKRLTVGEAVMQMNLVGVPALLFRNRGNDRLNLVYRRSDGHIGWVDPPAEAAAPANPKP